MNNRASVVLGMLLLAGCAHAPIHPPACSTQTQLFLGAGMGKGGEVDDKAFARFIDEAVLPRFPDRFTVQNGRGYWRGPNDARAIGEPVRTLIVVHDDTPDARSKLDAIAADYKQRFAQESVLRLDACAAFSFR